MTLTAAFIDDEPSLRDAAERLLPMEGIEVTCFADLPSYWDAQPDVSCTITDWSLLGAEAHTTLERLSCKPVILISGSNPPPLTTPVTFLKKPFRFQLLAETIRTACAPPP